MFDDIEEESTDFMECLEAASYNMGNPYLEEPAKGLELIRKICNGGQAAANWEKLEVFLEEEIWQCFAKIAFQKEMEYYKRMEKLRNKVREYAGNKNIYNKTIIGIGGMFSAGKSAFLNSILDPAGQGAGYLECEQSPTTSIPTYIMQGKEERIEAFKNTGEAVVLEQLEMQALTHKFYQQYKFGFNQYINKLLIQLPSFPYNNLIFLDTPGYSKADSSVKQNFTDRTRAKSQLQAADIIIWLVDCENGTIKDSDLQFLQELQSETKILFVFNKCDKKIPADVKAIIDETKDNLKKSGRQYEDVIAYSSRDIAKGEREKLVKFLNKANKKKALTSLQVEIEDFLEELAKAIRASLATIIVKRKKCETSIKNTNNPASISSLCLMYKYYLDEESKLHDAEKQFLAKQRTLATYFQKG